MIKSAMLERLHIENFALIKELSLDFSPRLNILTGETGAGKSILIDALRFVLGEKMSALRADEKQGVVEVVFHIGPALRRHELLESFLNEDDTLLVIRRDFNADGRSRAFINNRTVTAANLKQVGSLLLDIHGQYDHQLLLNAASHTDVIDALAQTVNLKSEYQKIYQDYQTLVDQRQSLRELEQGRERELDLLQYQIEEIEKADLREGEEEEIRGEHSRMVNSEKLHEAVGHALACLDGEEVSVSRLLMNAFRDLQQLCKLDATVEPLKSDFETAQLSMEEVIRALSDYRDNLSFDADRLNEIDKRLDLIDLMKRKYGATVSTVLQFFEDAKKKYDQIANRGLYEKEIDDKIKKLTPRLTALADELSQKRKKAAAFLKKMIGSELKDLEIPQAVFECAFEKTDFSPNGFDQIEFMISLNPGQPLMPLKRVVSAGEVSRVMLAIKKALMKADPVPTLIFDEIDANIGGRLGQVTGQKLKEISAEHQVLLITHLPQIASFADRHFKVTKQVRVGKTFTEYEVLEGDARVHELAQMMSGKRETDISKKHAKEMLKAAKN